MEELAQEDAHKYMAFWYEYAVDEQKKELREYKKKLKARGAKFPLPQVELIPEPIEDDESEKNPSSGQGDRLETAEAKA